MQNNRSWVYTSITHRDEGDDILFGWKQNYLVMRLIEEMKGFDGSPPPLPIPWGWVLVKSMLR